MFLHAGITYFNSVPFGKNKKKKKKLGFILFLGLVTIKLLFFSLINEQKNVVGVRVRVTLQTDIYLYTPNFSVGITPIKIRGK